MAAPDWQRCTLGAVRSAVALAVLLLTAPDVMACKDRIYPEQLPEAEIKAYDHVLVITVLDIQREREVERHEPPFSFTARVDEVFKGDAVVGAKISGATSVVEEGRARCPIAFHRDGQFLVFLNGRKQPYVLPRYGSLYVSAGSSRFRQYVEQLRSRR